MLTLMNINDGSILGNIYGAGSGSINSLQYINSTVFAGASSDRNVYFWSSNFVPLYTMSTTHSTTIKAIVLAAPNILITGSDDWTAKPFNLSNNYQELSTYSHTTAITGLLLLSNGQIASWGNTLIKIWTWQTGSTTATITNSVNIYSASQVSGELIAAGDQTNNVKLWYITNGTLFKQLGTMSSIVNGMLSYPGGFRVISNDFNNNLKIWNWQNSTLYSSASPTGLGGYVNNFYLTADNKVLALSSNTIKYFGISSSNQYVETWSVSLATAMGVLAMNTMINGNF